MISVFSPSDKDLLHCHQSRDPWPVFTFKQHYWKYYLWKTGLCFGSRLSHRLIMLDSQLICRKARRMRGRKCWVWTELQTQAESNLLLGSWRPRLHCEGCHGNGFNYAASFITEIFSWETIRKHFQTWFPKFWKRSLQVFYCCQSQYVIRKANTEWDGGAWCKSPFTSSSPFSCS